MNAAHRFSAVIQGQPVDRRPVAPVLSLYGAGLTGCNPHRYYTDAEAYAAGQCAVMETIGPDVIFGPFCLSLEGSVFGSQVAFYNDQPPNLKRPALATADPMPDWRMDNLLGHPFCAFLEQSITLLRQRLGEAMPIAAITLSPVDLPAMIMGIENWLQTLLFDPDGTRAMIALTEPYCIERANRLLAAGATFVVMPTVFTNPSILTRQLVDTLAKPILARAFERIDGALVLHSAGAPMAPFVDLMADLPHVAGMVVAPGEDMTAARKKVGPDAVLIGNLDGPGLHRLTDRQVREQCLVLLNQIRGDHRMVLGTSAADIRPETAPETIRAMMAAAMAAKDNR